MRQNKKDQDIAQVISNEGFASEMFKAIAHAVMAKGGTMRHLRRVVKEEDLRDRIADLIVPAGLVVSKSLDANHYLVPVTYAPLPSFAELEKEFRKGNVSDVFDGRAWETHSSCVGMDRTRGEKVFYVHDVGRDWEREEQIAWGLAQCTAAAPNGYRPATREETYEFAKAHPELVDFVGLGSFAMYDGRPCVARVWGHGGRRILDGDWIDSRFRAGVRVLFVSK